MTTKEIKDLIKLVSESEIKEFKLSKENFEIKIRTTKDQGDPTYVAAPALAAAPAVAPAAAASAVAPAVTADISTAQDTSDDIGNLVEVKSPMVGTFYRSPSPDKDSYVLIGDSVKEGDVVCIIEAMKLFNEIESEVSGKIVKVLVDDASPVEYDQPLFLVDPKG
jgi:acetyl-CoA carboxylase biotin carboxyl carrier protein